MNKLLLGREVFDALFLVKLADEQGVVLLGNDVTVEALHHYAAILRSVNDAVAAVEQLDITHRGIATLVVLDVGVQ